MLKALKITFFFFIHSVTSNTTPIFVGEGNTNNKDEVGEGKRRFRLSGTAASGSNVAEAKEAAEGHVW